MARINNLTNFLTDVASAIKAKKGSQTDIPAANFDTEIASINTVNGEQITINPSTSQQIVTPTQGHNAITQVTVPAVTSAIDANITQNNIKSGVTILGVAGNLQPDKPDQTKSCTPTTSEQIITPDAGYELASVTVNPVTAAIDANITTGNIKNGVTILGVTGTYEGSGSAMKEYASAAAMNTDIANISEGEVVKVTTNPPAYYIKDTGVMVLLVKETETLTPAEYNGAVSDTNDILGIV